MATIDTLMKTQMVMASPRESVQLVARRMRSTAVGAVLVVENGALFGLFSERDLVRRVVAPGKNPSMVFVGEVATRNLVTVTPDTHIARCVEIFKREGFRHLPVVDGGRPLGILSARDLFAFVSGALEASIDDARYRALLEDGADPYDHVGGSYATLA